jgi:hypothetical protein
MYIYFWPLPSQTVSASASSASIPLSLTTEAVIPTPTSDGGLEHTAAAFAPLSTWLQQAQSGEIIMFPPQFFLIYLLSIFLKAPTNPPQPTSVAELQAQRDVALEFLKGDGGNGVKWADKCISPQAFATLKGGRAVLSLHDPGPELKWSGRRGDDGWVVLVRFKREGARDVDVVRREEIAEELRGQREKESKL